MAIKQTTDAMALKHFPDTKILKIFSDTIAHNLLKFGLNISKQF